jgi:acetylornithine deacetylase/succinyl-diaminopimelate desuccinylase-like protein
MDDLPSRVIDLAIQIQQIPAPTFSEGQRAEFVRGLFQQEGLKDVSMDSLGNVYGRISSYSPSSLISNKPLVVIAHLDTVFPAKVNLRVRKAAGKIYGPGIGDNSLGVAALFGLVWSIRERKVKLKNDLWLVADVGEEGLGDLRGMRRVVERFGARARATLVLEGMALGYIQVSGVGVRRYRFTARTEGGHSWLHFGRPSAIHALVRLGARLTDLVVPLTPKTTFNIGTIGGGTSVNTIAREAALDLDLRSEDPALLAALIARVEELAASFNAPGTGLEMQVIGNRPSGAITREHPLVQLAARAAQAAGLAYAFESGSTDANLPLSLGMACVSVGLARGGNAHRPDEYIETREIEKGWQAFVNVVRGAFTLT